MNCGVKVVKIFRHSESACAAAMTLVDDYQIEKLRLELSKRFVTLLARKLMIETHENLTGAVKLFIFYLAHDFFEQLKILCHDPVDQNISVGKVETRLRHEPAKVSGRFERR